jgi:hypothetical protein
VYIQKEKDKLFKICSIKYEDEVDEKKVEVMKK